MIELLSSSHNPKDTKDTIEDAIKRFISDVLLGISSNAIIIEEPEIVSKIKKGLFHAVIAGLNLSQKHKSDVLISILDNNWSGIIIIVRHPKNYAKYKYKIKICRIQLGIVEICDDPHIYMLWPSSKTKVHMYLI